MRRARSAITGRIVKLATARRWPGKTVVERVPDVRIGLRVDDRRPLRVTVEPLGDVRPGDTLIATIDESRGHVPIDNLRWIKRELDRWVAANAPGAEVLVVAGEVSIGIDRTRISDVDTLLRELEGHVARWDDEGKLAQRPDLLDYAQTLAHGITALRYVLDGDPGHGDEEAAAA